jgi:hypothetical protein
MPQSKDERTSAGPRASDARSSAAAPPSSPPRPEPRDPGEHDLDLSVDELPPTRNLKEGFTGQER